MLKAYEESNILTSEQLKELDKLEQTHTAESAGGKDGWTKYEDALAAMLFHAGYNSGKIALFFEEDPGCQLRTPLAILSRRKRVRKNAWKISFAEAVNKADEKQGAVSVEKIPDFSVSEPRYDRESGRATEPAPQTDSERIVSDRIIYRDQIENVKENGGPKKMPSVVNFLRFAKDQPYDISVYATWWQCSIEEAWSVIDYFIKSRGLPLSINGNSIRVCNSRDIEDYSLITDVDIPYVDLGGGTKRIRFGVLSDTHFGSPQCDIEHIEAFYTTAYNCGIRTFFHAGDWTDGVDVYKGHIMELSREGGLLGFDRQLNCLMEYYPKYNDAVTYGIIGNHDESYIKKMGANPLHLISSFRDDIKCIGNYQSVVRINGEFHINLHHKGGRVHMQKPEITLRNMAFEKDEKMRRMGIPFLDLLVVGHYHTRAFVETTGVRKAMMAGGFQKATSLVKQHGFVPFLGGFIVTMYLRPDGTHEVYVDEVSYPAVY